MEINRNLEEDSKRFINALEGKTLYVINFSSKNYNLKAYSCSSKGMNNFRVMMKSLGVYTENKEYSTLDYKAMIHKVIDTLLDRNLLTKKRYYKLSNVNIKVLTKY